MKFLRSNNRQTEGGLLNAALAVSIIALASACTDVFPSSTAPVASIENVKQARSNSPPSQANLLWADSVDVAASGSPPNIVAAGIRGDGRDKRGQPASFSEYQGDFCGVSAYLGDAMSSLNTDSDFGYTTSMSAACGGSSRVERFYFDGSASPTFSFGPHFVVLNLAALAVGGSMSEELWYGVQQTNCQRLYFSNSYNPSNNGMVTRLADIPGANGIARQWSVESTGSHRAMCVNVGNGGKLISTGVSHFLPFSYTLTEILPPTPVYP